MQVGNQSWADPSPALLFGLAAGLTPLGLLIAGRIPAGAGIMVAAYLFGVTLSNVLCGLILLRKGDVMWGCLALFFGTMLCGAGSVGSLLRGVWALRGMQTQIPFQFEGWAYLMCGLVLLLFLPVLARVSWSIVASSVVCGGGLVLLGIGYIGGLASQGLVDCMHLGGWGIAIFGVYCLYGGFALLIDMVYQKNIIPIGAPLVKTTPAADAAGSDGAVAEAAAH